MDEHRPVQAYVLGCSICCSLLTGVLGNDRCDPRQAIKRLVIMQKQPDGEAYLALPFQPFVDFRLFDTISSLGYSFVCNASVQTFNRVFRAIMRFQLQLRRPSLLQKWLCANTLISRVTWL